ncbi:urease accessory UreF family protein [Microbacterium sp. zg-Y818]|uniref:urease accessory protein UreF n=2 Tax=Microbacterium TaxID=33882 RepID=UPI00214B3F57|nr:MULTISPECIES: urease accessory UreF family protein [unclassified Microbacterium]MCR2799902.1 urease accessory protein [Microbacterium sp. zg.Y818]WIM21884.1 urease accessory UreF family protein [Microbacterium sp. zg-Y818]
MTITTTSAGSAVAPLLVGLQLTDSAFPSGFYTMSHGLEGFHQAGLVDAGTVGDLLEDLLISSVGPGDATALARAHGCASRGEWDAVAEVDRVLYASKLNAELRTSSVRSGRQLADITAEIFEGTPGADDIAAWAARVKQRRTPGCQPVVTAVCYAAERVPIAAAVAADLFAFAASYAFAALRLRLADHRSAQVMIRRVHPVIEAVTEDALVRPVADIGGFVPMGDIMSAGHERAEARLFTN